MTKLLFHFLLHFLCNLREDEDNSFSKETSYKLDSKNYKLLDDNRLSELIEKMNTRPLIKADDKLRLSLAGAQEKLALAKINGEWYSPGRFLPGTWYHEYIKISE